MLNRCHLQTQLAVLTAMITALTICGCSDPVAQNDPGKDGQQLQADSATDAKPKVDIATQPLTLPEKDASAKVVCERFLKLLAAGEQSLAEQLLTRKAFKTTVDAGLELEAVGGPGASVSVGEALYATNRAQVAQVPCTVTGSKGAKQEIQWMMRHSESGWRVVGLIVASGDTSELLSFENKADVAAVVKSRGDSADSVRLVSGTDEE